MPAQIVRQIWSVECDACKAVDEGSLHELTEGGWLVTGPNVPAHDVREIKAYCWTCASKKTEQAK